MSRIQVGPDIHFGKPCVGGTRVPVQAVLELVRDRVPAETIVRDYYPDLEIEDVRACVQYAITHLSPAKPLKRLQRPNCLSAPG
jgi:uncharacterized protein (DUF433 family)